MTLDIQLHKKDNTDLPLSDLFSNANLNMLWCHVLVKILFKVGIEDAVICPGSRIAPLAMILGAQKKINTTVILDERSAAFFALGQSKKTQRITLLICTSGTAVANFLPAIIEAYQSHIPLLILTADRPLELQGCHSPQTIDQIKIFNNFVRWSIHLALPEKNIKAFSYLRQTVYHAAERAFNPQSGPVHIE
jgi:2-succinyl-5-enolpyruvyl-6-hydroxy-3-cyclohexene-1-carboxylate synthase